MQDTKLIEKELTKSDLLWLSEFEKSIVQAAKVRGVFELVKRGLRPEELIQQNSIDEKIVKALIPVLLNTEEFKTGEISQLPKASHTVQRLLDLFDGGSAFLKGKAKSFSEMWIKGEIDQESAKSFSESMFMTALMPARIHCTRLPFIDLDNLVDLGGGGGAWAQSAVQNHTTLKYTIFDLANVCLATIDILKEKTPDYVDRIKFVSGSFFTDCLPSAEGYLLSNILHDWPIDVCRTLLRKIHSEIPPGSRLFVHECLLNEEKTGPKFTVLFNMLMLLNHSSQQLTLSELARLLNECGFSQPQVVSNASHYSLLQCEKI